MIRSCVDVSDVIITDEHTWYANCGFTCKLLKAYFRKAGNEQKSRIVSKLKMVAFKRYVRPKKIFYS